MQVPAEQSWNLDWKKRMRPGVRGKVLAELLGLFEFCAHCARETSANWFQFWIALFDELLGIPLADRARAPQPSWVGSEEVLPYIPDIPAPLEA